MIPQMSPGFILESILWSALATLGFAFLFNVPRRLLPACVAIGATGYLVRQVALVGFGQSLEGATLMGAMTVGFLGFYMAQRVRATAIIFQVAAAIPLVPGMLAFQAMIAIIRVPGMFNNAEALVTSMETTLLYIVRTTLVLAAIGFGIAVPTLLFRRRSPIQD